MQSKLSNFLTLRRNHRIETKEIMEGIPLRIQGSFDETSSHVVTDMDLFVEIVLFFREVEFVGDSTFR